LGARLATTAVTGVASFNNVRFTATTTGHIDLAAAYQATGDTVITVAGSGIGIVTSGRTDTLYNIGVTSFNGFTGAVQVTGSGAILHTVSGTTTTLGARLASSSVTGVASFGNQFVVSAAGAVSLTANYVSSINGATGAVTISPAGSTGYIQYHTGAGFSADNGLFYTLDTETLTIGSGTRRIEITPGVDNFVSAFGNSTLRLTQDGGNQITIGDFDGNYGGNNTYLEVDDSTSTVSIFATNFNCQATAVMPFGLSASALYVSTGATFDGNTTLGNAASDTTTIYGTKIVNEGVYANGSLRTANISFANGQVQTLTGVGTGATGTTAIYFTNAPSTGAASVTMIITNGGLMTGTGMTAWGGNIKWPGGIKPVLSSSGIDVVSFVTPDAGSTIYGFVGGLNFT
jgi:hypothetical protein